VKRRKFITLLGGAAAAPSLLWSLAARAQPAMSRMARVAYLGALSASTLDPRQIEQFKAGLIENGLIEGRNITVEYLWAEGSPDRLRQLAADLARRNLDVIVTAGPQAVQIAPGVTRAAVIRDAANPTEQGQFGVIQAAAPSLRVEVTPVNMRDAPEIERAIVAFARAPKGGLIVTASGLATAHRDLIVTLATQHKLPAVYFDRSFVTAGGLVSYGVDYVDQYRRAAGYVDRILKGEKPADLPVQAPTKYQLVINLKTAKALGLDVQPTLIARADELIE
jgi:ABC-type uncharacterized transport system substrate-binding protein